MNFVNFSNMIFSAQIPRNPILLCTIFKYYFFVSFVCFSPLFLVIATVPLISMYAPLKSDKLEFIIESLNLISLLMFHTS